MTVYVDELRQWPTKIACFRAGSCHLTADTLEELHEFAGRIGLRRAWFQDGRVPHYDLTPSRREHALAAGARFVPARQQSLRRLGFVVHWVPKMDQPFASERRCCAFCGVMVWQAVQGSDTPESVEDESEWAATYLRTKGRRVPCQP